MQRALDAVDERALTIYVDGSMYGSPRRGGIGIHFVWVNESGGEEAWDHSLPATMGATNNEMELEAPFEALKLALHRTAPFDVAQFDKVVIRTDSRYVHENFQHALWTWPKTGWTRRGGGAVLHVRAWKSLVAEIQRMANVHHRRVHFDWIKGKKGTHAKTVDKLAKQSANSPSFGRARPTQVTRKLTSQQVATGSVTVEGQLIDIRVIEVQYLPPPRRESRYKYEVVDEASPFKGCVDWAESKLDLKRAASYRVRMNDLQRNPRIDDVIEELLEDLTPYLGALAELGGVGTVAAVATALQRGSGSAVSKTSVRVRLDRLVDAGKVRSSRSTGPGRPFSYELVLDEVE